MPSLSSLRDILSVNRENPGSQLTGSRKSRQSAPSTAFSIASACLTSEKAPFDCLTREEQQPWASFPT